MGWAALRKRSKHGSSGTSSAKKKLEMEQRIDAEMRALLGPDCYMLGPEHACQVESNYCPVNGIQSGSESDSDGSSGTGVEEVRASASVSQQAGTSTSTISQHDQVVILDLENDTMTKIELSSTTSSSSSNCDASSESGLSSGSDSDEVNLATMFTSDATATPREKFSGDVNDAFDMMLSTLDLDLGSDSASSGSLVKLGAVHTEETAAEREKKLERQARVERYRKAERAQRKEKMAKMRKASPRPAADTAAEGSNAKAPEKASRGPSHAASKLNLVGCTGDSGPGLVRELPSDRLRRDSTPCSRPSSPIRAVMTLEACGDDFI